MLNTLAKAESIMNINSAIIEVSTITTIVEPISSWRVDHETLDNSDLTSLKKFITFLIIFVLRVVLTAASFHFSSNL